MTAPRRFPPPWRVEESTESFRIVDATGQALAYVYFEDEDGRRKVMNRFRRTLRDCRNCLPHDDGVEGVHGP